MCYGFQGFNKALWLRLHLIAAISSDDWLFDLLSHVPPPWPAELPVVWLTRGQLEQRVNNATLAFYVVDFDVGVKLFLSFWHGLPAHSGVALKVSQGMVRVAEELMYFTQESSWSNGLHDVIEVCCTSGGCIAFRGWALGSHMDHLRMGIWRRHWERHGLGFFRLGLECKTDKVTRHEYELMYDRTLPRYLRKDECLLEFGFGCTMSYGPGASAGLWPKLYPEAQIHVVEIDEACVKNMDPKFLKRQNYTVHVASQSSTTDLERVKHSIGKSCLHGQLSVVVDDGSHQSTDIIASFHSLYPLLRPGASYFIEDIGSSSYKALYTPSVRRGGLEHPGVSLSLLNFSRSFIHTLYSFSLTATSSPKK